MDGNASSTAHAGAAMKNKIVLQIEGRFPKQFYWLKSAVIKYRIAAKAR